MKKEGLYDNAFYHDNVYGHAVSLLGKHLSDVEQGSIHLDLGCGFGRIAEPLVQRFGTPYVGVDCDPHALEHLASRGLESHRILFEEVSATLARLREIIGNRRVASISMLDTLEHLNGREGVLEAIHAIASEHRAFVVISVPNVAHVDIGRKLAFGQWDYTEAGLLDRTHLQLFTSASLGKRLAEAGLHAIDEHDVVVPVSDQHFPVDHVGLARGSLVADLLHRIRMQSNPSGHTQQFVRICVAGPRSAASPQTSEPTPFLSVVIRTQGTRPHTLNEVFCCLAAQSVIDYEVVVVGHKMSLEAQISVERVIEDCPQWLRDRTRLLKLNEGNRTKPLNLGFQHAKGTYIAMLDDDDTPMGHWVESFRDLACSQPGRVLRTVNVRQNSRTVCVRGIPGLRAEGTLEKIYPSEFDLLDHLVENRSPNLSLAFPASLFRDLNMRFDEDLTTTEDWDLLLRSAALVGVAHSPQITSIYRWWTEGHSSRSEHQEQEWRQNYEVITRKLDRTLFLLPEGSVSKIRALIRRGGSMQGVAVSSNDPATAQQDAAWLREKYLRHLLSSSWKISGPFRIVGRLFGTKKIRFDFNEQNLDIIKRDIMRVRRSASWRMTKFMRARKSYWWDQDVS